MVNRVAIKTLVAIFKSWSTYVELAHQNMIYHTFLSKHIYTSTIAWENENFMVMFREK